MRKVVNLLTVTLMFVGMLAGGAIGLFAGNGESHAATKPAQGSLTIHKYWGTPITAEGTNNGLALTGNELAGKQPLANVVFNIWSIGKSTNTDAPYPPSGDWVFKKDGDILKVTNTAGVTFDYPLAANKEETGTTGSDGTIKFEDLDKEYYYVEEDVAASNAKGPYYTEGSVKVDVTISSQIKPFMVAVPITHPTELDKWVTDVHVYPKNQGLSPEKSVNKPSINKGDTVTWNINANVPEDFETYTKFDVVDEFDARLKFVQAGDDVAASDVTVRYHVGPDSAYASLIPKTDYEVTLDADNKLTVKLTTAGIAKVAATGKGKKIYIKFDTFVNTTFPVEGENIVDNDATIEFENGAYPNGSSEPTTDPKDPDPTDPDPTDPENPNPNKPTVNVGDIVIDKVDDDKTKLVGAEFKVAVKGGNEIQLVLDDADNVVRVDTTGKLTEKEAAVKDSHKLVSWIARPYETDKAKLGLIGNVYYTAHFDGLQTHTYDDKSKTKTPISYVVTETKTAKGYNLLEHPVEVSFKNADTEFILSETIVNTKGFTLPSTGGPGLILLTVAGIIIVGFGFMVAMPKKTKKA